jgi:hypothetical protein
VQRALAAQRADRFRGEELRQFSGGEFVHAHTQSMRAIAQSSLKVLGHLDGRASTIFETGAQDVR